MAVQAKKMTKQGGTGSHYHYNLWPPKMIYSLDRGMKYRTTEERWELLIADK